MSDLVFLLKVLVSFILTILFLYKVPHFTSFCRYWGLYVVLCANHKPMSFHCRPSSHCSPGHSRIDLFYVSSVLVVTQPEVCSKTHRLMFSPFSLHHFSLSPLSLSLSSFKSFSHSLFFPLSETFGSMEQFQNHLWDCVMWCRHRMLIGLSEGPPSPTQAFHSNPSLSSSAVIGLDVIPTLTPMCWDVVCKLIADILGTWCQRFFISRFPLLSSARLRAVKMIPPWNAVWILLFTHFVISWPGLNRISFQRPGTNGTT